MEVKRNETPISEICESCEHNSSLLSKADSRDSPCLSCDPETVSNFEVSEASLYNDYTEDSYIKQVRRDYVNSIGW